MSFIGGGHDAGALVGAHPLLRRWPCGWSGAGRRSAVPRLEEFEGEGRGVELCGRQDDRGQVVDGRGRRLFEMGQGGDRTVIVVVHGVVALRVGQQLDFYIVGTILSYFEVASVDDFGTVFVCGSGFEYLVQLFTVCYMLIPSLLPVKSTRRTDSKQAE